MTRNLPVPIVNNAPRAVTFVRQNAGSDNRGTITVEPGRTHYEPGPHLTYETLVLMDLNGQVLMDPNGKVQQISMDELADDNLEKIEVNHNFQLVRHERRTWKQKLADWNPFKSRPTGGTLPTHNNDGHA